MTPVDTPLKSKSKKHLVIKNIPPRKVLNWTLGPKIDEFVEVVVGLLWPAASCAVLHPEATEIVPEVWYPSVVFDKTSQY